ncbi:hypothetical protein [Algoriphagus sp.]|uniref:hypothetical protein n=1 Tax=Algoriphagus sp. TaxID=1872435 RepID=UPI002723850B|nr:hypothetical protein [Algoriphagus sp.]MDO8967420.1 hypothetical protein [Algoriphagus sp.]MDP3198325.1 hypothetical protein [Algoriphagus sp.]
MTTVDLKKHLIQRISEINDSTFLEAIKTILDTKSSVIRLTTEQREEIKQSQEQINQRIFITQDQLDEEFGKWANEN